MQDYCHSTTNKPNVVGFATASVAQSALLFSPRSSPSECKLPVSPFRVTEEELFPQLEEVNAATMGFAKNLNLFWGITTALAVWFLFWHSPIFWKQRHILTIPRDVVLAIHIVTAGTIYMACAHNCLVTPSLHPMARACHTWVGRLGLISGIVSFSLGAYIAWSRLTSDPSVVGGTTLSFAIPITIGGILQLICEVKGFRAIREFKQIRIQLAENSSLGEITSLQERQRAALVKHIGYMLSLFVMACSIPAGIRLAERITGRKDGMILTAVILGIIFGLNAIGSRYGDKMLPPPDTETDGLARTTDSSSYGGVNDS
jgi:hypothetical protein